MASRGSVLACTVLLVLSVASLLAVDCTDDSQAVNEGYVLNWEGDDLTATGNGVFRWDYEWATLRNLTIVSEGGEVSLDDDAFLSKDTLETVTVQGSVGSIGNYAFFNCDTLTTVTIQGSVGSIGIDAFDDCDLLKTVTIQGSVGSIGLVAFTHCDTLTTVTIQGSVDSIGEDAFNGCVALATVTITGPISSIEDHAFEGCTKLKTVNIACNDPLDITKGYMDDGFIARYADTVNHVHRYSATYGWADDGKSCIVRIVCANTADHNHDENADVISTVKIQPTETTMGTTEYSISGTYDGFAYSDTKDVQDIPATGGSADGKKDNTILYIAVGGAVAAVVLIGGFFLLRRRRSS